MTAIVQQLLETFESLPDADKHEAAVEILRRVAGGIEGDLPENALVGAADELFHDLDTEEVGYAPRK